MSVVSGCQLFRKVLLSSLNRRAYLTRAFAKGKSDQQVIERALAKLTGSAATAAAELSATSVRNLAEALPMPIRIQLNNAIEEVDLLRFILHEATKSSLAKTDQQETE